ncbi:MAG: ankyrin repeat domain-containing protein [Planctomyces sp.]|nr:ankyrin repeat domain-containing protein [Planctomyces sp.]
MACHVLDRSLFDNLYGKLQAKMANPSDDLVNGVLDSDTARVLGVLSAHPELVSGDPEEARWLLREASTRNNLAIVEKLVECGADIHKDDGDSPEGLIYDAARDGAIDVVRWMLARGAVLNYDYGSKRRCMTMIAAARTGNLELVRLLVEHGAEFNLPWNGDTALSAAEREGHREIVKYLSSVGAKRPHELPGPTSERP